MVTGKLTCSASTETGIPTAPNAVGTVLATSDAIAAFSGLKPRAISIPMGIATAVPYPAAASRNPPKHHEIRSTWIRLSSLTLAQSFGLLSQQIAFQHYCQSLEQIEDRILQLDQEISRLLPEWSLCNLVCQLQALKGVGQLIAITLVAELGDFSRFSNPEQLMAFLGLVPGEYSSGNSIRPRGITKVGNSELRHLLYGYQINSDYLTVKPHLCDESHKKAK